MQRRLRGVGGTLSLHTVKMKRAVLGAKAHARTTSFFSPACHFLWSLMAVFRPRVLTLVLASASFSSFSSLQNSCSGSSVTTLPSSCEALDFCKNV